jgi:protein-S-isoprenylcysteine O-methyltransferase Ste14
MKRLLKNFYAFYRLFYVTVSLVLLIPLLKFTERIDNEIIIFYSSPMNIVRYVLIAGSLLVFLWAFFFDYDPLSFFGIRQMLNYGKIKNNNMPGDLKKSGLLGIVRHPMYLALIIYLWCQTFTIANIVVNTVLTIYIIIGTLLEEKKLVLEFGDAYIKYQSEVPMLVPLTKKKKT